jgi:NAD(P)-dependent dehydrogenase (short-subunit alcohol dehydrogenase family)
MRRLIDKVCIITGGAGGIGFAAVQRFLDEGAKVVLADINAGRAAEKVETIATAGLGSRIRAFTCDISEESQFARLIQFTLDEFDGIDCLFNNAGIGGAYGRLVDTRVGDWDRTLAIVLRGTFLGVKHAAQAMIRQGNGGSIINNASIVAHVGDAAGAAYSAAKAGILGLTRTAARELAPYGIRVNSISPGTIVTPLLHRGSAADDLHRAALEHQPWPEVEEGAYVASSAAFLASDDARFMMGTDMSVDGGAGAAGPGFSVSEGDLRRLVGAWATNGPTCCDRFEARNALHEEISKTGNKP